MFDDVDDPDMLLELVEDLLREENTLETLAEMEAVEVALSQFLEEKNAALFEQDEPEEDDDDDDFDEDDDDENQDEYEIELQDLLKPPPPLMPPPGALLDREEDQLQRWQQQERDLTKALESLRQRLWQDNDDDYDYEENEIGDDDEPFRSSSSLEEQEILQQAEEALRKSREAAERRKQEVKRRSFSAAKVSGGSRQQNENDDDDDEEERDLFGVSVKETNEKTNNKKRPTIQLGSLFGKRATSNDISGDKKYLEERNARAPKGLPILYDWVQDEEGSITGKIRRSINFRNGASISTSCVALGARGGTVVRTESGSR